MNIYLGHNPEKEIDVLRSILSANTINLTKKTLRHFWDHRSSEELVFALATFRAVKINVAME